MCQRRQDLPCPLSLANDSRRLGPVRKILGDVAMRILRDHNQFKALGSRNIDIYQPCRLGGIGIPDGPGIPSLLPVHPNLERNCGPVHVVVHNRAIEACQCLEPSILSVEGDRYSRRAIDAEPSPIAAAGDYDRRFRNAQVFLTSARSLTHERGSIASRNTPSMRSIGRAAILVAFAAIVSSTGLSKAAPSSEMISGWGRASGRDLSCSEPAFFPQTQADTTGAAASQEVQAHGVALALGQWRREEQPAFRLGQ